MINFLLASLPAVTSATSTRVARESHAPGPFQPRELPRVVSPQETLDDDSIYVARCVHTTDENERVEAFRVLLSRHRERVLNLAWQMLGSRDAAEDAAQEAFTLAFRSLNLFRGNSRFGTWIYRITINVCLGRKRAAKSYESLEEHENDCAASDHDAAKRAEKRIHVARTLDALSPPLRAVLVLREIHELSYEEIARVLSVPVGTVCSLISEARRKFIAQWEVE